ncbi:surface-adhesin E family protein [Orbaceae bacterium ac157xtp]
MRKFKNILPLMVSCTLLLSSGATFANDTDSAEKNTSLKDERVPSRYLPLEQTHDNDSLGYIFVDRQSVKIHPYNPLIRTYTRITNYGPALSVEQNGEKVPYRSVVSNEYANCDKKEFAKGVIQNYENYFGEGNLVETNDKPKRWERPDSFTKTYQNLIVICSLPVNK